ncbi:hypothetical protein CRG98_002592 [Punica granatum]|uniref:Uncharacterized protein n=1 Tax=Punica granatum TaxID=22663 RepID=A0A2I0L8Q8_PUNGR|nr:hypothetical protein CRG98_002592 [Punica granatum]
MLGMSELAQSPINTMSQVYSKEQRSRHDMETRKANISPGSVKNETDKNAREASHLMVSRLMGPATSLRALKKLAGAKLSRGSDAKPSGSKVSNPERPSSKAVDPAKLTVWERDGRRARAWEQATSLNEERTGDAKLVMLPTGGTLGMSELAQRYKSHFRILNDQLNG